MSFLSKIELRNQLSGMGIKIEGNYVRKSDIEKIVAGPPSEFKFAEFSLEPKDIKLLRPDWDLDKCKKWLLFNEKFVRNDIVQAAFKILEDRLKRTGN